MEKRFYYSPEMKFHQLKVKTSMLAGSPGDEETGSNQGDDNGNLDDAKGFGSFTFDEDED